MDQFTGGEGTSVSETIYEQAQITTTAPPVNQGYDPYLLTFRVLSLLFLLCLLFVAAIYYGVINP